MTNEHDNQGAREALVEQLAEAMSGRWVWVGFRDEAGDDAEVEGQVDKDGLRLLANDILPVVAAQVEAAVSVVRAEAAGKVDRASQSARRAGLRAQAVETERDEARAEAERLKRGGAELGKIVVRHGEMVLDSTGLHDWIDEDGDGDWAAVWENLATLRPRAESAESERDAFREKVGRVEALHEVQIEMGVQPWCEADGKPWPCPTVRALAGELCTHLIHTYTDGETPYECLRPATHELLDLTGNWAPVCDAHGRGSGVSEDRLRALTMPTPLPSDQQRRLDNLPCPNCGGDRLRPNFTGDNGLCHVGGTPYGAAPSDPTTPDQPTERA